jgi:hypothetical protein
MHHDGIDALVHCHTDRPNPSTHAVKDRAYKRCNDPRGGANSDDGSIE